ncbi:LysR family transcriptional regulator [Granulosicoccus sp. 3-233]|uniref:LysR family transcriptional regulator n=1 Tax=Granulosicoccus sp. 3-233 TaxID=3417969 RepID=UPI003D3373F2
MSQLPLNALRVFESVVRHGSFRAAADELCVSQSAVSHQIRHLEQWFDTPLFDRSGSRPQAMQRAEELADTLRHSLAQIRHACDRVQPRGTGSADLVIAAIPSVAVCWLIPQLSHFRQRHPDITIRIIYAFHGQALDIDDVDFAFVYADGEPDIAGTQAHYLMPGASVPVCSPAVAATLDTQKLLAASSDISFLHDSDTLGWQAWFRRAAGCEQSVPGAIYEDFNLLRAAVLSGQGVALCPPAMLQDDLRTGRLVRLSEVTVKDSWNYHVLEHAHSRGKAGSSSTFSDGRSTAMVRETGQSSARGRSDAVKLFKDWLFSIIPTDGRTNGPAD